MPPAVLYLVRHGQGEHNINVGLETHEKKKKTNHSQNSHNIRDAVLTDHGKKQCADLKDAFQDHDKISLLLASPLKRAIQTAAHAFSPALEKHQTPLVLVPFAQEISHLTCDLGADREVIVREAPQLIAGGAPAFDISHLDTSLVGEDWNSKAGIYAPTLNAVRNRAAALRSWLWQRSEEHIVLVSHGAFLHYLTEDWTGYDRSRGTGYMNCECRQYGFSKDSTQDDAHLVEIGPPREKLDRPAGLDAHVIHEIEEVEKASGQRL